uniref:RING-type domain-containing protein n=2 Tax=Schistosoma mansoni TaxID=6183 RepID=A0A5K4FCY6_SCHMA
MNTRSNGRRNSVLLRLDSGSKAQKCRRSSSSVLEPLEDMVTCPIDLNFLDNPKLLPCGHAFCCKCLNKYMEKLPPSPPTNARNTITASNNNSHNNNSRNNHNNNTNTGNLQDHRNGKSNEKTSFPCPICRALCPIPATRNADSFPSAFNHKAILEFLKNNHINSFVSRMNNNNNNGTVEQSDSTGKSPIPTRKTSLQVSSRMLNYIVDDIASRQREGRMNEIDRAVIIDEFKEILVNLQAFDDKLPLKSLNNNNKQHSLNVNNVNSLDKNTNRDNTINGNNNNGCSTLPCTTTNPRSSTPSTISPTNSIRHFGRFHAAASRIRRFTASSISSNDLLPIETASSYVSYRDAEGLRIMMERNSKFHVLTKGKDCCIMRPGEIYQPIDMKLMINHEDNNCNIHRFTLTTNLKCDELLLWKQQLHFNNGFFNLIHNNHKYGLNQISSQIIVDNSNPIKILYLRFHGSVIYLTGIITPNTSTASTLDEEEELDSIEKSEFGILVCCTISDEDHSNKNDTPTLINGGGRNNNNHETNSESNQNTSSSTNPFPIIATSSLFYRDNVGLERQNQPIIFGIDIDHTNGDIYIAQPANAMICRLKSNDLTRIDRTWYLNDPQLSPYFLCLAKNEQNVWATCPTEDKVLILDIDVDGYFHFTPSISFNIVPGHIIYTSDNRIILLDQSNYDLYWITRIEKAICVQRLYYNIGSHQPKKFQIMAIQPVYSDEIVHSANSTTTTTTNTSTMSSINHSSYSNHHHQQQTTYYNGNTHNHSNENGNNKLKLFSKHSFTTATSLSPSSSQSIDKLRGGIMCAHNYGCTVIYPQKLFSRNKSAKISSCLNLCVRI